LPLAGAPGRTCGSTVRRVPRDQAAQEGACEAGKTPSLTGASAGPSDIGSDSSSEPTSPRPDCSGSATSVTTTSDSGPAPPAVGVDPSSPSRSMTRIMSTSATAMAPTVAGIHQRYCGRGAACLAMFSLLDY